MERKGKENLKLQQRIADKRQHLAKPSVEHHHHHHHHQKGQKLLNFEEDDQGEASTVRNPELVKYPYKHP